MYTSRHGLSNEKATERWGIQVAGGDGSRGLNISCQTQLIEKNRERILFDLKTVGFLVSRNATSMAVEPRDPF
jgi:hypothetical protein